MLPPYNLDTLQNLNSSSAYYKQHASSESMREMALKQVAESVGMQAGLAHESKVINVHLQQHAQQMDTVFNFNQLLYQHYLLPPVIIQADNQLKVSDDGRTIRAGGNSYRIIKQVQFVTVPPTWRDYLWMSYQAPGLPDKAILPKNDAEQKIWAYNIVKGWAEGIQQGLNIFKVHMHQLSRDFNGMVLYKRLLAKNMVSPFYVKSKSLGITGDKDHITIDDHTMQVTDDPQFDKSGKLWNSVSVKPPSDTDTSGSE
jgi:defect in organelle trafficking protein DotC